MQIILSLLLLIPSAQTQQHHAHKTGHHHHDMAFKNAEKWTKNFDDPSRDDWQKPQELIKALQIPETAVIGDLGAGTGYFSSRLAKQFPQATVFAIDNEKDMTVFLQKRADKEQLKNLKPVLSESDGFSVEQPLDFLLIVDTYHHLPDREKYFQKILSQLKPDARIVIVDFLPSSPVGPPKKFRFQPPQIEKELASLNLKREQLFELPRQFVLVLKR
jgi:cyclopropane fatty-acyl-phospholipid synthase-like methyltransferase